MLLETKPRYVLGSILCVVGVAAGYSAVIWKRLQKKFPNFSSQAQNVSKNPGYWLALILAFIVVVALIRTPPNTPSADQIATAIAQKISGTVSAEAPKETLISIDGIAGPKYLNNFEFGTDLQDGRPLLLSYTPMNNFDSLGNYALDVPGLSSYIHCNKRRCDDRLNQSYLQR